MVGNEIYDPCFETPGLNNAVVCDASPARKRPGFILTLTKPLPTPSSEPAPGDPRPWLLKLADGSECEIETGTIAQVNGEDVPYDCSDSHRCDDNGNCPYMTGLTPSFKRGKVWTADKLAFSTGREGLKLIKRERVPVTAVWK